MNWFSWVMWNVVGPGLWAAIVVYGICAIIDGLRRKLDENGPE